MDRLWPGDEREGQDTEAPLAPTIHLMPSDFVFDGLLRRGPICAIYTGKQAHRYDFSGDGQQFLIICMSLGMKPNR